MGVNPDGEKESRIPVHELRGVRFYHHLEGTQQEGRSVSQPCRHGGGKMVNPSNFFMHGRVPCPKCGQINDLGSSAALYYASLATPRLHCGFLFLDHLDRQMKK